MELGDYVRILRRRGWIIILLSLLTALAAFGFSRMQTNVYKSTLNLLVRPSRNDFGQSQAAKELLKTYEVWLFSSYRAQAVIDALQLDMTAGELLGDVEVASDNFSFMVSLAVENTDPDLANDIARTWGNELIQWQQGENDQNRQEDRITIEFRDDPQVGSRSAQHARQHPGRGDFRRAARHRGSFSCWSGFIRRHAAQRRCGALSGNPRRRHNTEPVAARWSSGESCR